MPAAKYTAEHADHGCLVVLPLPLSGNTEVT